MYDEDIEMMGHELNSDIIVTPNYVTAIFTAAKRDINDVFREHFMLNGDFEVEFHHRLGIKRRTLTENYDADAKDHTGESEPRLDKRASLLKQITNQIHRGNVLSDQDAQSGRTKVVQGIKSLWIKHGILDREEQDKLIAEVRDSIKDELHVDEVQEMTGIKEESKADVDVDQLLELHDNPTDLEHAVTGNTALNIEMGILNPDVSNDL